MKRRATTLRNGRPRRTWPVIAASVALVIALLGISPIGRIELAAADTLPGQLVALTAADGDHSANATRLVDRQESANPADAWTNADNRWADSSYPMTSVVDLGGTHTLEAFRYYAGQIPSPSSAALTIESSLDGVTYTPQATGMAPPYDSWSAAIQLNGSARYLRLSFQSKNAHFDVTEVAVFGTPDDNDNDVDDGNDDDDGNDPTGNHTAVNVENSANAERLIDGQSGPEPSKAWANDNPWDPANWPMIAVVDLGTTVTAGELRYHVGNIVNPANDRIVWEYSSEASGDVFAPLSVGTEHEWNDWHIAELSGQQVRRVRVTMNSADEMVNLSEVDVVGTTGPTTTTQPETTTTTADPETTTTTDPGSTTTTTTSDGVDGLPNPTADGALQDAPPSPSMRADAFEASTAAHLSEPCQALHDRYWTTGPDGQAYNTWHPAITYIPGTTTVCDFGHEHGFMPTKAGAEVFNLSGGWPAFGYAAEQAGFVMNHESHEGHKVTVANFRAGYGNAADKGAILYDAGFDCIWLSKIHQGSFSPDAIINSVHEYFLTLQCDDGPGGSVGTEFSVKFLYTFGEPDVFTGVGCYDYLLDDNDTVSSVRAEITSRYKVSDRQLAIANPDLADIPAFTQIQSLPPKPSNPSVPWRVHVPLHADFVQDFDGSVLDIMKRPGPGPNQTANGREFVCASGIVWNTLDTIQDVTLWTQPNDIERNGQGVLTIQPYYSVIDMPWMIEGTTNDPAGQDPYVAKLKRTLDLCYPNNGVRLYADQGGTRFCELGPYQKPTDDWEDWKSPFNGTRRAVNFKSAWLRNGDSNPSDVERWCTDAYGRSTDLSTGPCPAGQIEQYAAAFDNHWNDNQLSCPYADCKVAGSIRSTDPWGRTFAAPSNGAGGYIAPGPAKEFIIDQSQPDDNFDGQPDGARIRGRN